MMMQSRRSQLIRAFLLLLVSSYAAASEFRGYDNTQHLIAGVKERGEKENIWYHPSRMLNPSTTCPWPDDITSLSNVRSGQYGSEKGDCFYMYWDPNVGCDIANGNNNTCPLFIYVDGTGHAANIDDRDSFYMVEMAQRGYVAVTVDYDDLAFGYTDGCDGFHEKSKKIFDASVKGSVLHQLCDDENPFGHLNHVPVDCNKGVVVNGWSQGSHVASLAGNYAPSLITAGLFWANGHFNWACTLKWPTCLWCMATDVSCMNSNHITLPKEKRRNIVGDRDSFFGACEDYWGANNRENVIDQQRAISEYSCSSSEDDCFQQSFHKAGYYTIPGKGHTFMDVSPASEFMNPDTPWGLPANFDWLAEQGRVQPEPEATSSTSSPSGVCSSNSGITAGNPCAESSECQCGRRGLHASDNDEEAFLALATVDSDHRGLPKDKDGSKGGGGNPNSSPTSPVTPPPETTSTPTDAPSPEPCGCINNELVR